MKDCLIDKVINLLNDECAALCSKATNPPSLFRKFPIHKADSFSWDSYVDELVVKAPILWKMLSFLVSRSDHRNKARVDTIFYFNLQYWYLQVKKGDKHTPGICTAVSILLKERNMGMSGLQTLTSLVLFSARVSEMVCVCVCVYTLVNQETMSNSMVCLMH